MFIGKFTLTLVSHVFTGHSVYIYIHKRLKMKHLCSVEPKLTISDCKQILQITFHLLFYAPFLKLEPNFSDCSHTPTDSVFTFIGPKLSQHKF